MSDKKRPDDSDREPSDHLIEPEHVELPRPPPIPEVLTKPGSGASAATPPPRRNVALEQLGRMFAIGTNFAAAVGGMLLVGYLLDRWLKTSPVCLLIGLGLGLAAGTYSFVRDAKRASRMSQRRAN